MLPLDGSAALCVFPELPPSLYPNFDAYEFALLTHILARSAFWISFTFAPIVLMPSRRADTTIFSSRGGGPVIMSETASIPV